MKKGKIPGPSPSRKVDSLSVGKTSPGKFSVSPGIGGELKKVGSSVKQTPNGDDPVTTKVGSNKAFGTPMAPVSFKKK